MPTSVLTLNSSDIKVAYREPYISKALNQKFQTVIPFGIYDGFLPVSSVTALHIDLNAGANGHVAIVQSDTDPDTQVSIHLSGTIDIDLSTYTSKTVAVVLEASYAFPSVTSAAIKVYDLATETVPSTACYISTVDVPASGVIPSSAISWGGRSYPWEKVASGAQPYLAITRNSAFDFVGSGTANVAPPYWQIPAVSGSGQFFADTTPGPSGSGGYVRGYADVSADPLTRTLYQQYSVPVASNQKIRVKAQFMPIQAPAVGFPVLRLTTKDLETGATVDTFDIDLDSTTLAVWQVYDAVFTASADAYVASIAVLFNSVEYGSVGNAFYITDIEVQVEAESGATNIGLEIGGDDRLNSLTLVDSSAADTKGAVLSHSSSTDILALTSTDALVTNAPHLAVPGEIYANGGSVSRSTPGTLAIGHSANVTQINIGAGGGFSGEVRLSQPSLTTRVRGDLAVNGSASTIGTLSSTGNFTVGASTFTVNAASGDTAFSGDLNIGSGNFTVDSATGNTYVGGTLNVAGGTIFSGNLSVTGDLTVTGVTNANGGLIRSTAGALDIGNTANATSINIGTASAGNVTIGRSATTTAIGGPLAVDSAVDTSTATALTVGTTTATGVTVGRAPTAGTTVSRLEGNTVHVGNDADTTAINIGATAPTGSRTVAVGVNSTGNTVTVSGGSITAGSSTTATLALGTSSTSSAAITIGNAPAAGTVTTSVQGNTLNIGTDADTGTLTVGVSPTGGTRTTTIEGNTVNVGEDVDNTTINIGTSDPTTSRTISIGGNYSGAYTVLYGQIVSAGDSATSTLSVGTTTTSSAIISVGNAPSAGTTQLRLQGNTVTLGTDADTTSISIGHGAITTQIYAGTGLRLLGNPTYVDTNTSAAAVNIGTANAGTITIGRTTRTLEIDSTTVNISEAAGVTTVKGSLVVDQAGTITGGLTTASVDNTGAALTLGASASSTTLGQNSATTTIRGSSTAINSSAGSGNVTIGLTGNTLLLYGDVRSNTHVKTPIVDEITASALEIGPTTATQVLLGKSGASQIAQGNLFAAEKLYAESSSAGNIYRILPPVFARFDVSNLTYNLGSGNKIITLGKKTTGTLFRFPSTAIDLNTSPTGNTVQNIPQGYYHVTLNISGSIATAPLSPSTEDAVEFEFTNLTNIEFSEGVPGNPFRVERQATGGFLLSEEFWGSFSCIALVSGGVGSFQITMSSPAGATTFQVSLGLENTNLILVRIASNDA